MQRPIIGFQLDAHGDWTAARELKQLRDDTKLKRLVADLSLDKVILRDAAQKVLKPVAQREAKLRRTRRP